jgi:hypothetical protein
MKEEEWMKEEKITAYSKELSQHSAGRTKRNERFQSGELVLQLRVELVTCHIRDKQL